MSRRPHLTVVRSPEEEAHIEPPSTVEKQSTKANHATWKFDLFATVAGDPLCNGACLQTIVAYSHFCSAEDRTAYLSEIDLTVRTGRVECRVLRAAKKTLVSLGYLDPIGKTSAGIVIYRLANPRKEIVAEHRLLATEKLKEEDAFRREEERRRRKIRRVRSDPLKEQMGGADQHLTGGSDQTPNTVENSVERYLYERVGNSPHDARGGFRDEWSIPMDGSWPPLRGEVDQ